MGGCAKRHCQNAAAGKASSRLLVQLTTTRQASRSRQRGCPRETKLGSGLCSRFNAVQCLPFYLLLAASLAVEPQPSFSLLFRFAHSSVSWCLDVYHVVVSSNSTVKEQRPSRLLHGQRDTSVPILLRRCTRLHLALPPPGTASRCAESTGQRVTRPQLR